MSELDVKPRCGPDRNSVVVSPSYGTVPLDFLVTGTTHACAYLPGRTSTSQIFAVLDFPPELYHDFMDHGFRRSGRLIYRPVCDGCRECRAIRVVVSDYRMGKSHRRVINKNQDLEVKVGAPKFTKAKFRIYEAYLAAQHDSDGAESPDEIRRFLYESPVNTLEFEYRLNGRLVAVGIVDLCSRSLSAVYAYYDPEFSSRSLGTYSAIREILFCRERGIPYYYMGFVITACPSMVYKSHYRPHEILDESFRWVRK